jgi:hypothetical protein
VASSRRPDARRNRRDTCICEQPLTRDLRLLEVSGKPQKQRLALEIWHRRDRGRQRRRALHQRLAAILTADTVSETQSLLGIADATGASSDIAQ